MKVMTLLNEKGALVKQHSQPISVPDLRYRASGLFS